MRSLYSIKRRLCGVSRTELLVVGATLSLVALVNLPMLGSGHASSKATVCRNNLRTMMNAWLMYADDHDGAIAPAGRGGPNSGKDVTNQSWMGGWLDFSSSYDNVNNEFLYNPEYNGFSGHLGPYFPRGSGEGRNQPFRCPEDTSTVVIFGRDQFRSRSVSINNWMGGNAYCGQNYFKVYRNLDQISQPAYRFVVIEERPDSINDALWFVDMENNMIDYPGFYHQAGAFVSFADGHVEYKRWQDSRTIPPMVPGGSLYYNLPTPGNPDLQWLRERATELE